MWWSRSFKLIGFGVNVRVSANAEVGRARRAIADRHNSSFFTATFSSERVLFGSWALTSCRAVQLRKKPTFLMVSGRGNKPNHLRQQLPNTWACFSSSKNQASKIVVETFDKSWRKLQTTVCKREYRH